MKLTKATTASAIAVFGLLTCLTFQYSNSAQAETNPQFKPGNKYFQMPVNVTEKDYMAKTVVLKIKSKLGYVWGVTEVKGMLVESCERGILVINPDNWKRVQKIESTREVYEISQVGGRIFARCADGNMIIDTENWEIVKDTKIHRRHSYSTSRQQARNKVAPIARKSY